MPLIKSKSKAAFGHNVEAEMDAGKPQKQSLAIAYSMAKRSKKKSHDPIKMQGGGSVEPRWIDKVGDWIDEKVGNDAASAPPKPTGVPAGSDVGAKKLGKGMAAGGMAHAEDSGYLGMPEEHEMHNESAMSEADKLLNQHMSQSNSMKHGAIEEEENESGYLAMPESDSGHQDQTGGTKFHIAPSDKEVRLGVMMDSPADRIMNARKMSKGGMIANGGDDDLDQMADGKPNNFDDLALRDDDMEDAEYTGANSGDELGNAKEDHDRSDMVSRIMASRRLKDRLPKVR